MISGLPRVSTWRSKQALVQSSAAQLELLQVQRAQNEHAIATLVGAPARVSRSRRW